MMYVCLWSPGWSTDGASPGAEGAPDATGLPHDLAPLLAELAPRLRVERERIWADGRGLDAVALGHRLVDRLAEENVAVRAGVAAIPIVAELAARWGPRDARDGGPTPFLVKERTGWGWRKTAPTPRVHPGAGSPPPGYPGAPGEPEVCRSSKLARTAGLPSSAGGYGAGDGVVAVSRGSEAAWLASLPVMALRPDDRLRTLLEGVGVDTVGALAGLARESVEVRFGPAAVDLWRLARGDDRRLLFEPVPPERPHGSIDFVDYVLTDPSRLLFTANALLGPLCDRLVGRGEHARALRIVLPLANGEFWERTIRPARPTASRETWLRLIRGLLERLTVPDAVAGMRMEVGATEAAAVRQGDLFDRGFASASAVEAAVARLAERQVVPVTPEVAGHPLMERRARWREVPLEAVSRGSPVSSRSGATASGDQGARGAGLSLQLLPAPRRIGVETVPRRDHEVPARVRDRDGWREVPVAVGPDRISGGQWEEAPYAREYFRCVTDEGVQLWLYRDGLDGGWYLHGYWD